MRRIAVGSIVLLIAACASPSRPTAEGPIAANMVLLGETRHERKYGDYDWLLVGGVDKRWRFLPKAPFQTEKNRFHEVSAGRHTIHVRLMATAHRGLPGLRDAWLVFENVELDGGRAYVINGQRHGEVFDIWIEDYGTKEHITSAMRILPPRLGM
jgi:hypothetical protein